MTIDLPEAPTRWLEAGPGAPALDAHIPSGPIEQKWDKHKFELKLINPANR